MSILFSVVHKISRRGQNHTSNLSSGSITISRAAHLTLFHDINIKHEPEVSNHTFNGF